MMGMRTNRRHGRAKLFVLAVGLILSSVTAGRAESTIELQVGPLSSADPALGLLVVDTAGDGVAGAGPWLSGLALAPGAAFGSVDDIVVAVFPTTDAVPWPSGTGFATILNGMDFAEWGASAGDRLHLFWLPSTGISTGAATVPTGVTISSWAGNEDFVVPDDGTTVSMAALGGSLGDGFDLTAVESGTVEPADLLPSDGSSLETAIGAGETVYFSFELARPSALSLAIEMTSGVADARVFDASGDEVHHFSDLSGDTVSTLPRGFYYLALTETSEVAGADASIVYTSSGFQPDVWLRRAGMRNFRGNDRYDARVRGFQTVRARTLSHRGQTLVTVLENDAETGDRLGMRSWIGGRRNFRLRVFERGRGNVTGAILSSRYRTFHLGAGERTVLSSRVYTRLLRRAPRRSRLNWIFLAQSLNDPAARDRGRFVMTAVNPAR